MARTIRGFDFTRNVRNSAVCGPQANSEFQRIRIPPPYPALSHLHISGLRLFISSLESFILLVIEKEWTDKEFLYLPN